ncbi:MAG: DUF4167 domain-containing protein [Dichotomicrobium sp.]
MRQGQQNRRGRNRSGGRKPQSALSRNFESNGPNVKIRGTASHIAEKYMALARDALSSGDMIGAENYFQHAEHYNRIILAAQADKPNGAERHAPGSGNGRDHSEELDMDGEEDEPAQAADSAAQAGAAEPDQSRRRQRKSANGAGQSDARSDGNGSEGQKSTRGRQARRGRQKVETTAAGQKAAKAANGAGASTDDGAPDGFSA